jgi:hypothetical protein
MRRAHLAAKLKRTLLAVGAILIAAMVVGLVIDGIGFIGTMLTVLALAVAASVLLTYPRMKLPTRADLARSGNRGTVGQVQLWLEAQRPALPAPAVPIIDQIGRQLDTLNLQLKGMDETTPAAQDARKLVGEHLPELVSAYTAIPASLRSEKRVGHTPDEQLVESLKTISGEIDGATRQLADGALDRLAIQTRYLDYRYGENADEPPALNPPSQSQS